MKDKFYFDSRLKLILNFENGEEIKNNNKKQISV